MLAGETSVSNVVGRRHRHPPRTATSPSPVGGHGGPDPDVLAREDSRRHRGVRQINARNGECRDRASSTGHDRRDDRERRDSRSITTTGAVHVAGERRRGSRLDDAVTALNVDMRRMRSESERRRRRRSRTHGHHDRRAAAGPMPGERGVAIDADRDRRRQDSRGRISARRRRKTDRDSRLAAHARRRRSRACVLRNARGDIVISQRK